MPGPVGVTNFRYIGVNPDPTDPSSSFAYGNQPGGLVRYRKATAAIALKAVVSVDASNATQVVTAPTGAAATVVGVCVGSIKNTQQNFDAGPAAGEYAIIQFSGDCQVVADSTVVAGGAVIAGTSTAGRVDAVGVTTTEPTVIGIAWEGASQGGTLQIALRL